MPTLVIEDPELVAQIERVAQRQHREPVDVIAEAVQQYDTWLQRHETEDQNSQSSKPKKSTRDFLQAITALGASGHACRTP